MARRQRTFWFFQEFNYVDREDMTWEIDGMSSYETRLFASLKQALAFQAKHDRQMAVDFFLGHSDGDRPQGCNRVSLAEGYPDAYDPVTDQRVFTELTAALLAHPMDDRGNKPAEFPTWYDALELAEHLSDEALNALAAAFHIKPFSRLKKITLGPEATPKPWVTRKRKPNNMEKLNANLARHPQEYAQAT